MRRKFGDEVVHIAAQESPLTEANACHARRKQMTAINGHQIGISFFIHRHAGDNADPNAQAHVGFDDIGIRCGKGNSWRQAAALEGVVQFATAGKTKHVGNQRIGSDLLQ